MGAPEPDLGAPEPGLGGAQPPAAGMAPPDPAGGLADFSGLAFAEAADAPTDAFAVAVGAGEVDAFAEGGLATAEGSSVAGGAFSTADGADFGGGFGDFGDAAPLAGEPLVAVSPSPAPAAVAAAEVSTTLDGLSGFVAFGGPLNDSPPVGACLPGSSSAAPPEPSATPGSAAADADADADADAFGAFDSDPGALGAFADFSSGSSAPSAPTPTPGGGEDGGATSEPAAPSDAALATGSPGWAPPAAGGGDFGAAFSNGEPAFQPVFPSADDSGGLEFGGSGFAPALSAAGGSGAEGEAATLMRPTSFGDSPTLELASEQQLSPPPPPPPPQPFEPSSLSTGLDSHEGLEASFDARGGHSESASSSNVVAATLGGGASDGSDLEVQLETPPLPLLFALTSSPPHLHPQPLSPQPSAPPTPPPSPPPSPSPPHLSPPHPHPLVSHLLTLTHPRLATGAARGGAAPARGIRDGSSGLRLPHLAAARRRSQANGEGACQVLRRRRVRGNC